MLAGEAAMALENARLYDEIRHQALHDGLTGLANRVLFRDRVVQALERRHGREGRPFAVLFIDLDDFKVLNDTLGHVAATTSSSRPPPASRPRSAPSDTAARLGGDEFAVLLDDVGDEQTALSIAIRPPTRCASRSTSATRSVDRRLDRRRAQRRRGRDGRRPVAERRRDAAKAPSRGRAEVFRSTLRAEAAARQDLAALLRGVE